MNSNGPIIIPTTDGEDILSSQVLGADAELLGSMEGVTAPRNPRLPLEWIEYEVISWDTGTEGDNNGILPPRRLQTYGKLVNFIMPVSQKLIGSSYAYTCVIIPEKFILPNVKGILQNGSGLINPLLPPPSMGLYQWAYGWYNGNISNFIRLPEDTEHKFWVSVQSPSIVGSIIPNWTSCGVAYGYQKRGG